jgi:hypothetical protein
MLRILAENSQLIHSQACGLRGSQTTSEQQSQNHRVSLPSQSVSIGSVKQFLSLIACDKLAVESRPISAAQSLDALLATPTLRRRATGRKGPSHVE